MNRYFMLTLGSCLWLALNTFHSANAGLVIQFSIDGGTTFDDSFEVAIGSSTSLEVFLTDTDGAGGVLATDGLIGFALTGDVISGNSGDIVSSNLSPSFDIPMTDSFSSNTIQWEAIDLFDPVPAGTSIALGRFQFDAFSSGTSTIVWSDAQPGSGSANADWASGSGAVLDENIFGTDSSNTFSMSISTVPEPSSFVYLSSVAIVSLICRSRRRQRTESSPRGKT